MSARLVLTLDEAARALVARPPAGPRERAGITRVEKRCPTCAGLALCRTCRGEGYLWLRGDEVECPPCEGSGKCQDCAASGTFTVYRQPVEPPGARVFMPGQTYGAEIVPVELESV